MPTPFPERLLPGRLELGVWEVAERAKSLLIPAPGEIKLETNY